MNKLKFLWSNLRSSLWFLPLLIVAASILLAVVLIETDSSGTDRWLAQWQRLFGAGAAGARIQEIAYTNESRKLFSNAKKEKEKKCAN